MYDVNYCWHGGWCQLGNPCLLPHTEFVSNAVKLAFHYLRLRSHEYVVCLQGFIHAFMSFNFGILVLLHFFWVFFAFLCSRFLYTNIDNKELLEVVILLFHIEYWIKA